MRLETDGGANQGVLAYICGSRKWHGPLIQPAAALIRSRPRDGPHPDIVHHLWEDLAPRLSVDCTFVVCGVPALVAPRCGILFAVPLGTEYGLRLAPAEFALARAAGAEVVHHYRTAGVTLDLAQFGPEWVFGTFDRREPQWCAAALEFAEATNP